MSVQLDPGDFQIVWFSLGVADTEAAVYLLDHQYEESFAGAIDIENNGIRLYAGRMCGRDIVIATRAWDRDLKRDPNWQATLANTVKGFFPNLLIGLMVGIVPAGPDVTQNVSKDVRPGHVLVGLLDSEMDEKLAYYVGNKTPDQWYTPEIGESRKMINSTVQEAINNINFEGPDETHKFSHYYGVLKAKYYLVEKHDMSHSTGIDLTEKVIKRDPKSIRRQVWHGPIDTGNYYATKNARYWGRFRTPSDIGSLLPVCVIRGIYYPSNKRSEGPLGQSVAAAYTKTILHEIMPDDSRTAVETSGFERNDTGQASEVRSRRVQHQTSQHGSARTPPDSITDEVKDEAIVSDSTQPTIKPTLLFRLFHRSSLIVVVILFALLGGVMITLAVVQTRDSECDPRRNTLGTDDGFWTILGQFFFLVLSIYCTVYPVAIRSRRREAFIDKFWFWSLLLISFITALAAIISYAYSWRVATILGSVSSLAQVVSAAQLANSLEPTTGRELLPRRGTLEMEEFRSR